jgi:molecular chaperone DnaK (HSP70)
VNRVLVDVSPYSFGPSYLGQFQGRPYVHCYHPIIQRNTPLPITRTDSYYTAHPYQTEVKLEIYQGDDPDALKNTLVGEFVITGLTPMADPNEVLCRMSLDLDGILHVVAIEKMTGKSKHITISDVFQPMNDIELAGAQQRVQNLYARRSQTADKTAESGQPAESEGVSAILPGAKPVQEQAQAAEPATGQAEAPKPQETEWEQAARKANELLEKSRGLLETMHSEDQEDAVNLHEAIQNALDAQDAKALSLAVKKLQELLFFVEGR